MSVLYKLRLLKTAKIQLFFAAIITILLVNYFATSSPPSELPSVSALNKSHGDSFSKYLDDLNSPDAIGKTDILEKAISQLKKENEGRIREDMEKEYRLKYEKQILSELKQDLEKEMTRKIFKQDQFSGSVWEEVKSEFLLANFAVFSSYIAKDMMDSLQKMPEFKLYIKQEQLEKLSDFIIKQAGSVSDIKTLLKYVFDEIIVPNDPGVSLDSKNKIIAPMFDNPGKPLTEKDLKVVDVSTSQFEKLQVSHDAVVKILRYLKASSYIYSGEGIIINANDAQITTALVLVIQIRDTSCNLPIEIVLNSEKSADKFICNQFLPRFNAKCVYIDKTLPFLSKLKELKNFQLKVVGILASSFDNAIVLDADNVPIEDITGLLHSQEFAATGFVVWRDIWGKTTSPHYYDLARFETGEVTGRQGLANDGDFIKYLKMPAFHDREGIPNGQTAETGQMIISKLRHIRSLLLALYYNYYGPDCYYNLFYQGAAGEGDKDTFVPALHVMEEPYTMVENGPELLGYNVGGRDGKGEFVDSSFVHYAPTSSKYHMIEWRKWLKSKNLDTRLSASQDNKYTRSLYKDFLQQLKPETLQPLFLHVHKPKINPLTNYKNEMGMFSRRILGKPLEYKTVLKSDFDWELKLQSISAYLACTGLQPSKIFDKLDQKLVCDKLKKHVEKLKVDSPTPKSATINILSEKDKKKNNK